LSLIYFFNLIAFNQTSFKFSNTKIYRKKEREIIEVTRMSTVTGGCLFTAVHCCVVPSSLSSTSKLKLQPTPTPTLRFAVSGQISAETTPSKTETTTTNLNGNGRFKKKREEEAETEGKKEKQNPYVLEIEKKEIEFTSSRKGLDAYFEGSRNFIKSDGGPPRWFSPLECGSRLDNSPLLLFLPGDQSLLFFFY
jgi:hypothetical protein